MVADDGLFRDGLRSILSALPGAEIAPTTGDRTSALRTVDRSRPHVILVDLGVVPAPEEGFLADLVQAAAGARLLILAEWREGDGDTGPLAQVGIGVVSKRKSAKSLLDTIDRLLGMSPGSEPPSVLDPMVGRILRRIRVRASVEPHARLTRRENEIAELVSHGLNNRELAARLGISEATVRHHLTSIFAKVGVRDRVGLVIASLGRARRAEVDR